MTNKPTAWVLLGKRMGDNNQAIALAEALGLDWVEKTQRFTRWRYLPRSFTFAALATVDADTRASLAPPWPALVVAVGKRSVPVARAIKRLSGGATRIVMLGEPRSPPHWFDLVLTTPQYRVPPNAPNVRVLPIALARGIHRRAIGEGETPAHVLLVGGPSWPWRPDEAAILAAARHARDAAERDGGVVLAMTGGRTAPALKQALVDLLGAEAVNPMDYRAAVARGTIFYVTADSISMLSDAITTGRPVAMLPAIADPIGGLWVKLWRRLRPHSPLWPRDQPRFWSAIREQGLVGTIEQPRSGAVPDAPALVRAYCAPLLEASNGDRHV